MKVLLISTSEKAGGAAIAASRLRDALNAHGIEAKMLVRGMGQQKSSRWKAKCAFVWERAVIWLRNGMSMKNLWRVDIANAGVDITRAPEFREADIIHLHWINQGMLSIGDLRKIFQSGKRIVWTMHDQWPYTGVCHHAADCLRYQDECRDCPLLCRPGSHDLSNSVFRAKKKLYGMSHITFVGCSQWISDLALKSILVKGQQVCSIPNPIPSSIFHPMSQNEARGQFGLPIGTKLVLFAAFKVTDEQKGFQYMEEALCLLPDVELVVVGNKTSSLSARNGHVYQIPYISSESLMASLYAAVDVFVTPSLQENLPNTIAEAMSVGTPCVGFHVGGIPEMIDHKKNGYVARVRDARDLAEGIRFVLSHDLRDEARKKALEMFSEETVVAKYKEVYEG